PLYGRQRYLRPRSSASNHPRLPPEHRLRNPVILRPQAAEEGDWEEQDAGQEGHVAVDREAAQWTKRGIPRVWPNGRPQARQHYRGRSFCEALPTVASAP